MVNVLFIGTNWITKQLLDQILFDDTDDEAVLQVLIQETDEDFWTEYPRLKQYVGDDRLDIKHLSLSEYTEQIDNNSLNYMNAVYITDTEPDQLDLLLKKLKSISFKGPIILASTWQVYGWKKRKQIPISEKERPNPETELGKHMTELEKVMLDYGKGKALQTIILRYSEIIGPSMPEEHDVIKLIIDAMSSNSIIVEPPQSRQYDWLHIKYIYNLVPKLFKKKFMGGEIYNIGSGEERKITWLANALKEMTDSDATVEYPSPPEGSPLWQARGYHSLLDISKAKSYLSYDPDGQRIQYFLEVARWVEWALGKQETKVKSLEETYPMLQQDFEKRVKDLDAVPESQLPPVQDKPMSVSEWRKKHK